MLFFIDYKNLVFINIIKSYIFKRILFKYEFGIKTREIINPIFDEVFKKNNVFQ